MGRILLPHLLFLTLELNEDASLKRDPGRSLLELHSSSLLVCAENTCNSYGSVIAGTLARFEEDLPGFHAYLCVPQPQPTYSTWGGSQSAGSELLRGIVGAVAQGLANSNSGQGSSGSGYSSSVPDTTADEQGRREQEFIQLQRQEQQMRQQHPPQN